MGPGSLRLAARYPEQLRALFAYLVHTGTQIPAALHAVYANLSSSPAVAGGATSHLSSSPAPGLAIATGAPAAVVSAEPDAPRAASPSWKWFSEAAEQFRRSPEHRHEWSVQSTWKNGYEPPLRMFRELVAKAQRETASGEVIWDIGVAEPTVEIVEAYVDAMWKFPGRQGKRAGKQDAKAMLNSGKERMRRLMDVVAAGRVDLKPLVTHRFKLDQISQAYDLFSHQRDGVLKVAITP